MEIKSRIGELIISPKLFLEKSCNTMKFIVKVICCRDSEKYLELYFG